MLVLSSTTDKLVIILEGVTSTNKLQFVCSWRDITTIAYTPGRSVGESGSTIDVDMVASPAASTQRVIDFINIFNADTDPETVILKYDDNATQYVLGSWPLEVGERLEYTDHSGFLVLAADGSLKTSTVTP